jgi:2-polyprenyl-6-methoxyphenol hydroxylase-like FAD-dependent oxidoreductase
MAHTPTNGAPSDARSPNGSAGGRPRVVIVGAGFAGIEAAQCLEGAPVDVMLVDRNNYHKFQPLLYQMATLGRNAGIAELAGGIKLKGVLAWLIWAAVHVAKLPGLRNRVIAFMNWFYNYLTYDRKTRMIVDTIPLNREAQPSIRRHYHRLQAMETEGVTHEFIGENDDR